MFVVVGAATAASGPSGDAATIAFYRQVLSAYRTVPAITATRHGYVSYTVSGSTFHYVAAEVAPPGYRRASESVLVLLRGGRVWKYVDHAAAPGLPSLTIIEDATGLWAALNSRPGACYYKNPRSSGVLGWGSQFVGVFGDFAPLRRAGALVTVHSTYPWGKSGAQASEVDQFFARTKYWRSFQVHVNGSAPFTWTMAGFHEGRAPSLTAAPTPHC
jgi:hypothetical protein